MVISCDFMFDARHQTQSSSELLVLQTKLVKQSRESHIII